MWNAYNYTKEYGIQLKGMYHTPYLSKQGDCMYNKANVHFQPTNLGMIELDRNVNLVLKRLVTR
jgi:hypothetical protein